MEKRHLLPPDDSMSQTFARVTGTAWNSVLSLVTSGKDKVSAAGDGWPFASPGSAPQEGAGPVRILVLSANPAVSFACRDLTPSRGASTAAACEVLAQDEEVRAIDQALNVSGGAASFKLETKWAVRCSDVQEHLLRYRPQIVHLSGHGLDREGIVLLDANGAPKPVSGKALEGLFKALRDDVRMVLLNACWSAEPAQAISRVVGCAIGMQGPISDLAAISFAAAFYRGLGFGRTIRDAFELGRSELELQGFDEAHVPQLFEQHQE